MFALETQPVPPRPFLKWAGGKTQLIQQYQAYFPQTFRGYYEPFLGGAAIFFHLRPARAVLTDINPQLVNVYRCVRDSLSDLVECLEVHQRSHNQAYYYAMRSTVGATDLERAARFIYLNKTCFNGLYRENLKGEFNVPMGRYKDPKIYSAESLQAAAIALQKAEIQVSSFKAVLESATAQDFVYFDPPYHPISLTSCFTAYSRSAFGAEEQIQLRDTFAELAQRGVKVMLSNSDSPYIQELYQGFNIHTVSAARAINSKAEKRGKVTELLVTSY